jgi:hypothetical protein
VGANSRDPGATGEHTSVLKFSRQNWRKASPGVEKGSGSFEGSRLSAPGNEHPRKPWRRGGGRPEPPPREPAGQPGRVVVGWWEGWLRLGLGWWSPAAGVTAGAGSPLSPSRSRELGILSWFPGAPGVPSYVTQRCN